MLTHDMEDAVSGRELGHYPLSIATSLAIEGMTHLHPDTKTPSTFDVSKYDVFLVNIDTLIRNLFGSVSRETRGWLKVEMLAYTIAEEMQSILEVFKTISPTTEVVFYHTPYINIERSFPNAKLRIASKNQQLLRQMSDEVIVELGALQPFTTLKSVDTNHSNALILTHKPLDLIRSRRYRRLVLIESHTGVLKDIASWWTKLHRCKVKNMPFNEFTLQLYGDNQYFNTQPIKYKRLIEDLAETQRWSSDTTTSRIRMGISGIREKELRDPLMSLLTYSSEIT